MRNYLRVAVLVAGLGLLVVLSGCPGMPGAGGGAAAQQTPPGVQPPPGLESGGVRTLLGTTVTPPTNSVLLVNLVTTAAGAPAPGTWQSVRRITITDSAVLLEGLNYNGREENRPQDVNRMVPLGQVTSLTWRYEGTPAPVGPPPKTGEKPAPLGRRGR